jgi:HEAT repeat protein
MRCILLTGLVALGVVCVGAAKEPQGSAPTDAEVRERAKRLELKNDKESKLEALNWLREHAEAKNAELAIAALEQAVREDPDEKVRGDAIVALGWIVKVRKKPCPLVIVESLLDKDDYVASCAGAMAGQFEALAPGSLDIVMRCAESEREMVRQDAPLLLVAAGGKEKKILDLIEKLEQDKLFLIRQNAHVAMFKANGKMDEYVHWIIQVEEDPDSVLPVNDKDSDEAKKQRKGRDLVVLGMAQQLKDWQSTRPEELAKSLVKYLEDESPPIRRGAARLVGVEYLKNPHEEKNHERSDCAPYLDKLKAEDRLKKLLESEKDETVRRSVERALERIASVRDKKEN